MLYDFLPHVATAAVVSVAWFVAYRSQTNYLRAENERLDRENEDLDRRCVKAETLFLAEQEENAHLIRDVAYLNRQLAPFTAKRPRDPAGRFLKVAA